MAIASDVTHDVRVTIIKINAITVPEGAGDELARRFGARVGAVDGQPGFEGFELLKPNDGRLQWLVVTRWVDEDAFRAWVGSASFADGHKGAAAPDPQSGGPISTAAELWSYEIAGGTGPKG